MPVVKPRSVLSGLTVQEAMHRQVIQLPKSASLDKAINHLIKYKTNGLLVVDEDRFPVGVVSKTDLAGAFYGGLPMDSPLGGIMNGPLLTCFPDDELASSLDLMKKKGVHQLYIQGAEPHSIVGMLSYTDVVALLHRYCRSCSKSAVRRSEDPERSTQMEPSTVQDAMTASVISCGQEDSLAMVIEELMVNHLGAVLIQDHQGVACGVISKTDVILAYHHGIGLEVDALSIMKAPVASCDQRTLLSDAIRLMFLKDVHRLFTHAGDPSRMVGVLSLSDAAQIRSGSCRACIASRVIAAS